MTDLFLKNILSINPSKIPSGVYLEARICFLDYLACSCAGAFYFAAKERDFIKSSGSDGNDHFSTLLSLNCRSNPQIAALINGLNSHVLELDDGHRQGAIHVGGAIFSALLAIAEKEKINERDFLYAAIIGYEVSIRLACAMQPGNKLRGYHATGTCGTLGATVAIAIAMHFDFDQMKSALSAAVTSAAGILEMQEDDSDMKPLNVGRAAMDAIAAAYLGKVRFKAPKDALGGKRGFLKVMTDEAKTSFLTDFSSDTFAIQQIYRKIYAACRHAHPAIEAALTLRNNIIDSLGLLKPIKSIEVETYKLAIGGHDHKDISSVSSAKMSIPFSVALALYKGNAGMEAFTEENINTPQILKLTQKIFISENKKLSDLSPQKRAAILHITLEDGTVFSQQVDYPKGEPENPLSKEEFKQKFIELMRISGISKEKCEKILLSAYNNNFSISEILSLLS